MFICNFVHERFLSPPSWYTRFLSNVNYFDFRKVLAGHNI